MMDKQGLLKWRAQEVARLEDASGKAALDTRLGFHDSARRWLEQHAAPAAENIAYIDERLKEITGGDNGKR